MTAPSAVAATNTVVSLTFDDGTASHPAVASMLEQRGMRGTFYINTAMLGSSSYYMTWAQVDTIYAHGHEIGGHTLHHSNLVKNPSTAQTEVCDDRANLINRGYSPVNSFAYPEAAVDSTSEDVVKNCGYATGRGVGNFTGFPETFPPRDPYRLATADGITSSTTLAQLQSAVTQAETHGGGWVIFAFHGVCDNSCTSTNTVTTSLFTSFLDWLAPRSSNGTVVETVNQAMTGGGSPPPTSGPPTTTIACNGTTCSTGWYKAAVTVTLSASPSSGTTTTYSIDGGAPTTYSTPFTVGSTATVQFSSSNSAGTEQTKTQQINIDAAPPSVTVTSPTSGTTFARGATITIKSNPTDTGGSGVASVTYFYDGKPVGTSTSAGSSYSVSYKIPRSMSASGTHTITATAADTAGNNSQTSAPITINVSK